MAHRSIRLLRGWGLRPSALQPALCLQCSPGHVLGHLQGLTRTPSLGPAHRQKTWPMRGSMAGLVATYLGPQSTEEHHPQHIPPTRLKGTWCRGKYTRPLPLPLWVALDKGRHTPRPPCPTAQRGGCTRRPTGHGQPPATGHLFPEEKGSEGGQRPSGACSPPSVGEVGGLLIPVCPAPRRSAGQASRESLQ